MSFEIQNKVVLVTGANRGIGRAIVDEAVRRGAAKIYAAVRNVESAQPLVDQYGERVVPIRVDVQDDATVKASAQTADDVDVVINNAGALKVATSADENAIESLRFEMDVNAYGFLRVAQAFAPVLKGNGGGAIVQLNSVASIKNFAGFSTYSASKAASYSLTQGLRDVLKDQNTLVVSVHPGPIKTDMAVNAGLDEVAEPPSLVAEAIFDAVASGMFHVWPDTMAKQFEAGYRVFAENVVEAEMSESPA